MRDPKPFTVHRDGVYLFVIHAYSAQQAQAIIAARLADTTGIVIVRKNQSPKGTSSFVGLS